MSKRWPAGGALLAAALSFNACSNGHSAMVERSETPVTVRVVAVHTVFEPERLEVSGELVSANRFQVASKVAGRVIELPVSEGDRVRRGDLLVRIDAPELVFAAERARGGEEAARLAWETADRQARRYKRLAEGEVVTPRDLELAQLEEARARAALTEAASATRMSELNLGYALLRAPADGVVVGRSVRIGDLATPGRTLLVLEDAVHREVRFTLPARQSARLAPGMPARVEVDGNLIDAVVDRVAPGSSGRTVEAFLRADHADAPTGSYVRAMIFGSRTSPVLRVPETALVRRGPLTGVFAVRDGRAVLRWLRLTADARVLSGLDDGDTVVVAPPAGLGDGMPIEVAS